MTTAVRYAWCFTFLVGASAQGRAQPPPSETESDDPQLSDFYALFKESDEVVTANKVATKSSEAPAIITVIPQSTIQARGYRNVGEAVAEVPGFYVVPNRVTYAAGVRGIGYTADSFNQMIKFMVNGQPATVYSTGGALLGPEFIPIEVIDSIEIIRGPGSALYGTNAYLGVINVITKDVEPGPHLMLTGSVGDVASNIAGSGGAFGSYGLDANGTGSLLLATSISQQDRSGIAVRGYRSDLRGQVTESDTSHPVSAFARGVWATRHTGEFSVQATYQRMNTFDEFSAYGPLTHDMHLAMDNLFGRMEHRIDFFSDFQLHSFVGAARSQDLPDEEFRLAADKTIHRQRTNSAWEFGTELSWQAFGVYALAGIDYLDDTAFGDKTYNEDGTSSIRNVTEAGSLRPVSSGLSAKYNNVGYYLHVAYTLLDVLHITGGIRYDSNNLWESHLNWRAAATYTASSNLHFKVLYGTSMVYPALAMMYGEQMGTVVGSQIGSASRAVGPQQDPESAGTLELSVEYSFLEYMRANLNVFWTQVSGAFVLQPSAEYAILANTLSAHIVGGEATIEAHLMPIFAQINVSLAYGSAGGLPSAPQWYENVFGKRRALSLILPAFPDVMSQIAAGVALPAQHVEAAAVLHVVGNRNSSINNTLYCSKSYAMAAYATMDINVRTLGLELRGWGALDASFRVTNIFNTFYEDPGTMGVDIPTVGRTLDLRVRLSI